MREVLGLVGALCMLALIAELLLGTGTMILGLQHLLPAVSERGSVRYGLLAVAGLCMLVLVAGGWGPVLGAFLVLAWAVVPIRRRA